MSMLEMQSLVAVNIGLGLYLGGNRIQTNIIMSVILLILGLTWCVVDVSSIYCGLTLLTTAICASYTVGKVDKFITAGMTAVSIICGVMVTQFTTLWVGGIDGWSFAVKLSAAMLGILNMGRYMYHTYCE